ncbi:AAA family ATPase [candidate division WWE3 bacterium]|nr:AAA family ATPase [candidate division WWE3 bacterium]
MLTLFDQLNPQQKAAVEHQNGPALVVAGPGSGKTRVLTHRVAYLIHTKNIPQQNILAVTFTNKAAGEIKERVGHLLDTFSGKLSWSGTFHSISSRILRRDGKHLGIPNDFVIYDTYDQRALVKTIIKDFGIDSKKIRPKAVLYAISGAKTELVTPLEYSGYAKGYFQRTAAKIYHEYQKRLRKNKALDFDDLLMETVRLFVEHPQVLAKYQNFFQHVLVDEYQDTNKAQYSITKLLAKKHRNLYVVGDMAQAIYSFRGADYRNILNFQSDYKDAQVYNLEENYRSTQNILDAAKHVINNNSSHIPLDLHTQNGQGEKLTVYTAYNEKAEADFVVDKILDAVSEGASYKDIAVLYRTNAQSRNLEEAFIKSSIPYKIIGGFRFYARKEIKDAISYLRVLYNPKDAVSWERIINTPTRGIGKVTLGKIKDSGWDLELIEEKSKLPWQKWIAAAAQGATTLELLDLVLEKSGYLEWLDDGSEENKERLENLRELRSVAGLFEDLGEFLENVSLIESADRPDAHSLDAVTLMTIHASKGLEFPLIFMVGMEEGLFPHSQSIGEVAELEEERRLCYVAITRAKEKVFMTNTKSRVYFGSVQANQPSRFIGEIDEGLLVFEGSSGTRRFLRKQSSVGEFLDELDYDRGDFNWV